MSTIRNQPRQAITKTRSAKVPKRSVPRTAAEILRRDRGALSRIARQLGVTRTMVSGVLNGTRSSERVRIAIVNECLWLARNYDHAALLAEVGPIHGRLRGEENK